MRSFFDFDKGFIEYYCRKGFYRVDRGSVFRGFLRGGLRRVR